MNILMYWLEKYILSFAIKIRWEKHSFAYEGKTYSIRGLAWELIKATNKVPLGTVNYNGFQFFYIKDDLTRHTLYDLSWKLEAENGLDA